MLDLARHFSALVIGAAATVMLLQGCYLGAEKGTASQSTAEAERSLTEVHGEEARQVIENFHSQWDSLVALADPNIRLDLAVTPFVNNYMPRPGGESRCQEGSCLVIRSIDVHEARILEYGSERFKAIGCATAHFDEVTPQGEVVSSLPPYEFRHIYVFVRDDGSWKLAGTFDITIPVDAQRDWDYAPDWLRQTIESLPTDLIRCEA